jgi:hypothetical protein
MAVGELCAFDDIKQHGLAYSWKLDPNSFSVLSIEIGLELWLIFSLFEHAKNLLIMGPNNTKNSSWKCDFLIFKYE